MEQLVILIVGLVLIALLVYGESYLSPPFDAAIVRVLQALTIIAGALFLMQKAGVL